ncbi:MAG TPA: aminoglycoside phosphotransferase family protein [Steroidobacteraceae bacterium]
MSGTPAAEVKIDEPLILALLREQHPDLAHLPRVPVDAGWDNVMLRLGDSLCLRFPRRATAAALIEHEQTWLPGLSKSLPLATPVPLRVGLPGCGYPWRWSIVPWLAGEAADQSPPAASEATRLGEFLRALHTPAPAGAPLNPVRGVALEQRASTVEERMQRLAAMAVPIVTAEIYRIWEAALAAPLDVGPTWLHGDLHARNVLVDDGRLTGVIDWGDVTAGDRATDLAAVWMLFADAEARSRALVASGSVTQATYLRAKGWAVSFGVVLLDSGLVDHPRHAAMGEKTLRRVLEGP